MLRYFSCRLVSAYLQSQSQVSVMTQCEVEMQKDLRSVVECCRRLPVGLHVFFVAYTIVESLCISHYRTMNITGHCWALFSDSSTEKKKKKKNTKLKVARDSCDVTHSLKQASIHTSHLHASKSCTKYSLHLVQSASTH